MDLDTVQCDWLSSAGANTNRFGAGRPRSERRSLSRWGSGVGVRHVGDDAGGGNLGETLTGSSSLAALTTFCLWAATLAGPVIGTVADRVRRRALLIWANLAMAGLLPVLLAVRSSAALWLLFAVLVIYGLSGVLMDAAEAALVAVAVPADLRGDFNGLRMTANEGMKLIAPLAGAALFARFGGPAVALLDAGTFAVDADASAVASLLTQLGSPATARDTAHRIARWRDDPWSRVIVAVPNRATGSVRGGR